MIADTDVEMSNGGSDHMDGAPDGARASGSSAPSVISATVNGDLISTSGTDVSEHQSFFDRLRRDIAESKAVEAPFENELPLTAAKVPSPD